MSKKEMPKGLTKVQELHWLRFNDPDAYRERMKKASFKYLKRKERKHGAK